MKNTISSLDLEKKAKRYLRSVNSLNMSKLSKVYKKYILYIKKSLKFVQKGLTTIYRYVFLHWKSFTIGFASLILLFGLGYGIYKYATTPRAPDLKAADGGYLYKAKGLDFTAFIGNKEGNRPDVNFAVGEGSVVFTPASGNENVESPQPDGDKAIIFKNVYQDIDFRYQTLPLGIKEEIIINKPTLITTFPFFLDFKNVTPQYITENDKGTTFFDKNNEYLFNFEKPYAVDARGSRTDNLGISIRKDSETGKYVAIITLDEGWFSDPARAYPIIVDPTIVHDTSSEYSAGDLNRVIDTGGTDAPNLTSDLHETTADTRTVALWHMNESSGNVTDSSGNSYTGTPTGTTIVSGQNGFGNARKLNGSGDYIAFGDIMNDVNLPVTIEAWIYQSQYCDQACTIFHSDDPDTDAGNYYGFSFATGNTGNLAAGFYNGVSAGPDGRRSISSNYGVLPVGQWNHVAVVMSGSNDVSFFVNGQQVPTLSYSGTSTTVVHSSNPAKIGRNTRYGLTYFNGTIDEVRISDTARTPEEIATDALRRPYSTYTSDVIDLNKVTSWNSISWKGTGFATGDGETATASATSNLVAQWNFNETSGTTAAVATGSCGATCNGTLTNFASTGSQDAAAKTGWTSANRRWGAGALMFDGTNDYVTTGYQWNSSQPTTFEAWVNPASEAAGDWQKVIASNRNSGTPPYFDFYLNTGTDYTGFGLSVWNDAYTQSWSVATGGTKNKAGKWYHVVGVFYPNDKIQIYINGVLEKETTGLSGFSATGGVMRFGIHDPGYGANTRWFDGTIDTSRVYNKALTSSEILSNYNLGMIELQTRVGNSTDPNDGTWEEWRPVTNETAVDSLNGPYQYNTTDTGLTNYWPMDETSGTSVADVKGSNGGTATGTLVNDGQFAKARGFNGTSDYISVGNVARTQGSAYSVEFWAKKDTATATPIVYSENTPASWSNNLFIIYYGDNASGTNGGIRVWYRDSAGTGGSIITYTTNVADGKWHHVAFVQSATNSRTLYLDGVSVGTDTVTKNTLSVTNSYIGAANNNGTMTQFFNGSIDEVRTYNSALSSSTVQQHFLEGSTNANTLRPSNSTIAKIDGTASQRVQTGLLPADAYTVGLWHMEETGGTGAYIKDSSGNGNDGTPTSTLVTDGFSGNARDFNGTSSYISIPSVNISSLPLTIESWFYLDAAPASYAAIVQQNGNATNYYGFRMEVNSNLGIGMSYGDGTAIGPTGRRSGVTANNTVPLDQWVHVAGIIRGPTDMNIYLNGKDAGSLTYDGSGGTFAKSSDTGNIGREVVSSTLYFDGTIDEVRFSNIERSAEEIAETYRAGQDYYINKTISSTDLSSKTKLPFYVASDRPGTFLSATIGESPYSNYQPDSNTVGLWHLDENDMASKSGLLSWWRMDEASGTSLTDSSGAGNTSTATGTTVTAGVYSNARSFNGTSDYTTSANSLNFTSEPFTVSMWVNPTSLSNSPVIFSNGSYQVGGYYCHILSTGAVSCYTNQSGALQTTSSTTSFTTGSWQHLVVTRNGSSIRIFRNGIDVTSSAGTHTNPASTTEKFVVGTYGPSPPTWYYTGSVDDVRVYNRALSVTDINTIYGSIKDSSGNGNNATIFGNITATQGKIGKARSFNGTSDFITVGQTNLPSGSSARTLDAWVKLAAEPNTWTWVVSYGTAAVGQANFLGFATDTVYYGGFGGSDLTFSVDLAQYVGKWIHLAGTYNGTTAYLYINGELVASANKTWNTILNKAYIGRQVNDSEYFYGGIDEVRISNTARSAGQIRHAYEAGLRTHNITVDFKAALDSGNLITGSGDLGFTVDETDYGNSTKANHIFPGDKIIAKENYNGTEYLAQGTVNSVDSATGAVTVASWDSGSTFPSGGFTVNAILFKWQREYFDLTGSLSTHRDATTLITLHLLDGSQGTDIWFDDFRSSSGYLTNALGSTITSSANNRYAQYRAIISQNNISTISPSLTSVTLDYTPNSAPNQPTWRGSEGNPTSITFHVGASDPESDNLQYKIVLCTSLEMTNGCYTYDQTQSQTGWDSTSYASDATAGFTTSIPYDPGTTYYMTSYAIDFQGSNTWSVRQNPTSFEVESTPTKPTDLLTMDMVNPSNITTLVPYFSAIYNAQTWSAEYYQIQMNTSPDFSGTLTWDTGKTSTWVFANTRTSNIAYTGPALSWNGTYYWRIKFWHAYGEGPYSDVATFSLDSVTTSCRIQETSGDTSLTVVWTDNATTETGYEVQRSVDSGAFAVLHTGLAANTQSDVDSTISTGHTYQYRVAPYYSGGSYDNWCTTNTLTLQAGEFSVQGLDLKGLDLR